MTVSISFSLPFLFKNYCVTNFQASNASFSKQTVVEIREIRGGNVHQGFTPTVIAQAHTSNVIFHNEFAAVAV